MKKEKIPMILAILGVLLFAWSAENYILMIIGAIIFLLAKKKVPFLGKERVYILLAEIIATVASFGGGIAVFLSGGWEAFELNLVQFILVGYITFMDFFIVIGRESEIGKDLTDRYRLHCLTYKIPMYSMPFCYMTSINTYIAISEDRTIYSYNGTSIKKLPIKHISRYELQKVEGKRLEKAVLFENNGNYHEYFFSTLCYDRDLFIECLDFIMHENPQEHESIDEIFEYEERVFNQLCAISGIDPSIYPQDKVTAARMA